MLVAGCCLDDTRLHKNTFKCFRRCVKAVQGRSFGCCPPLRSGALLLFCWPSLEKGPPLPVNNSQLVSASWSSLALERPPCWRSRRRQSCRVDVRLATCNVRSPTSDVRCAMCDVQPKATFSFDYTPWGLAIVRPPARGPLQAKPSLAHNVGVNASEHERWNINASPSKSLDSVRPPAPCSLRPASYVLRPALNFKMQFLLRARIRQSSAQQRAEQVSKPAPSEAPHNKRAQHRWAYQTDEYTV